LQFRWEVFSAFNDVPFDTANSTALEALSPLTQRTTKVHSERECGDKFIELCGKVNTR
jgi:hypothetical protein